MVASAFRFLRLGFIPYFIAMAWFGCPRSVAESPPSETPSAISLEKSALDLGEIAELDSRVGQILVTNVTAFPVTIDSVSATCGCTSASITEAKIPSGGTSVLNIELSPEGRHGVFGSLVTLEWTEKRNDGDRKGKTKASAQATGVYLAMAKPGNLDFGSVSTDSPPVEKVILFTRGTQKLPFDGIRIAGEVEAIQTRIEQRDKDSWEMSVILSPKKLPSGPFRATITLVFYDTSGEEVAWREFSARAEITGLVSAKPKSLFFGVLKQGERREASVALSVPKGKSVAMKKIYTEPVQSGLAFKKEGDFSDGENRVIVRLNVDSAGLSGDQSGKIFVQFEDESLGSISIPYILHVR